MHTRYLSAGLIVAAFLIPRQALAQQPSTFPSSAAVEQSAASSAGQQVPADVAATAKRYRLGLVGGVGLHPVLIEIGAHANLGPFFTDSLSFRPGIRLGAGEVTTTLGFNLDVIYRLGDDQAKRWRMYAGGGANFALSHESFQADVPVEGTDTTNRLDFSDTDFQTGLNLIFGARARNGMFTEVNATAWGAHNVRLLVGYDF